MTHAEQQAAIDAAAHEFPPTFGLRDPNVKGRRFRINRGNSYWSDLSGVLLYTDIQIPESAGQEARWASYCKGTPEELKREATEDPEVTKVAAAATRPASQLQQASQALDTAYRALLAACTDSTADRLDYRAKLEAWDLAAAHFKSACEARGGHASDARWIQAVGMIESAEQIGMRAPAWCYELVENTP